MGRKLSLYHHYLRLPKAQSFPSEYEENWISGLISGEAWAFEQIYLAYGASLIRYAANSVSLDVAEDIVQEVFTNLWRRRQELDIKVGELTPYLFGAVRNQGRHHLRSVVTRERHSEAISYIPGAVPKEYASDSDLLANELYNGIQSALADIPDIQRETVVLRWIHGLAFSEISRILGISENAAMQYVSRIKRAIQPSLEKFFRDF